MAIQTVNIGTTPNDGTGDSLRTGADKYNDNFTDATNAASKLVQTSSTDTTAGRAVMTDALGDNGGPIFTEANLNTNVFEGNEASDVIGLGYAQTSSVLRVSLPISGVTSPTSITVVDGFDIQTVTLSTIETNITSITLSSGSSNKVAWLSITGLTGLTVGGPYYLRANVATSKITVNF